jgi:hypothetical protein
VPVDDGCAACHPPCPRVLTGIDNAPTASDTITAPTSWRPDTCMEPRWRKNCERPELSHPSHQTQRGSCSRRLKIPRGSGPLSPQNWRSVQIAVAVPQRLVFLSGQGPFSSRTAKGCRESQA